MKNLCFLTLAMLFVVTGLTRAQPDIRWSQTYGGGLPDTGSYFQNTSDGGYIITGFTSSFGNGGRDVYLIKTDASGSELWSRTFGGTEDDNGASVQQTTDGGYIIAGRTESFGAGMTDVYLIKTDADGNEVWSTTFGWASNERGYDVEQTTDGGYVVVGYTYSFSSGSSDVLLIKTDANGVETWSEIYGTTSTREEGRSVLQTADGGYAIVGYKYTPGPEMEDVYLVKTDDVGGKIWEQTFGEERDDKGFDICPTADGGHVIVGYNSDPNTTGCDVYLIKLDSLWVKSWERNYGGSLYDEGHSVQQTSDGGYIIAGRTDSFGAGDNDFYLVKTDADGNESWSQTFGGHLEDYANAVQVTPDGGYFLLGSSESHGSGNQDAWLIRLGDSDFDLDYGPKPVQSGQWMLFSITQADPNKWAWIGFSTSGLGCVTLPILDVTVGLDSPRVLAGPDMTDSQGQCDFPLFVPAGASGLSVWIQAVQYGKASDIEEITIQ